MLLPATRLVVKGVGIKVDGLRSNKKETISWSLSILFLDVGGPDDVGGVLGGACVPPLLFPGDERFRPSDKRDMRGLRRGDTGSCRCA
eukprot:scaffold96154_cov52-Attheya_sp.AAC.1